MRLEQLLDSLIRAAGRSRALLDREAEAAGDQHPLHL